MIRNNLLILIITFTQLSLFSQDTTTPAEMEIVLKEEFSNTSSSFPIITTIDNYFIIDNGDYLMSRNNTQDEYIILSEHEDMKWVLKKDLLNFKLVPGDSKIVKHL